MNKYGYNLTDDDTETFRDAFGTRLIVGDVVVIGVKRGSSGVRLEKRIIVGFTDECALLQTEENFLNKSKIKGKTKNYNNLCFYGGDLDA